MAIVRSGIRHMSDDSTRQYPTCTRHPDRPDTARHSSTQPDTARQCTRMVTVKEPPTAPDSRPRHSTSVSGLSSRQWPDSGPTAPDRARHPDSQGSTPLCPNEPGPGGGVVALGQTGERHPWISFFSAILPVRPTTDYLPYALVTVSLLCPDAIWMAVRPGGSVVTETTAMAPRET